MVISWPTAAVLIVGLAALVGSTYLHAAPEVVAAIGGVLGLATGSMRPVFGGKAQ